MMDVPQSTGEKLIDVEKRLAAVHEAGHIVVALASGLAVDFVFVRAVPAAVPEGYRMTGCAMVRTTSKPQGRQELQREAVYTVAADVAAQMFAAHERGIVESVKPGESNDGDKAELVALFEAATGHDARDSGPALSGWVAAAMEQAGNTLGSRAAWVRSIAAALIAREYLSGADLAALIGDAATTSCVLKLQSK